MEESVKEKLEETINLIEDKLKTFLQKCPTNTHQLFLLNYCYTVLDGVTAEWFSYGLTEEPGPYFEYEGEEWIGKFYPKAIRWLEMAQPSLRNIVLSHRFELYPQYDIVNAVGIKKTVDFAIINPCSADPDKKIKVAVLFDGKSSSELDSNALLLQQQDDRFFRSTGWLVARFSAKTITHEDMNDLIEEINRLVANKDYDVFQLTQELKNNWRFN